MAIRGINPSPPNPYVDYKHNHYHGPQLGEPLKVEPREADSPKADTHTGDYVKTGIILTLILLSILSILSI